MTLKDIAQEAGVSIMTVSNVINGKAGRFSEKTIQRINAIIERNHFVPNQAARALAANSSRMIGILIPKYDIQINDAILLNPYISAMLSTFEDFFSRHDYFITFRATESFEDEVRLLNAWNVDGLILLHPYTNDDISYVMRSGHAAIVLLDCKTPYNGILQVDSDDYRGAYLATEHLLLRGHRRIGIVGNEIRPVVHERIEGYKAALSAYGVPFDESCVFPYFLNLENGIAVGDILATRRRDITAVLASSDYCGIGIMEGLRRRGLRIPEDVSIIGYDNINLCDYVYPKLTSVAQGYARKAQLAAQLLYDRINGNPIAQEHLKLDVHLVERDSVLTRG